MAQKRALHPTTSPPCQQVELLCRVTFGRSGCIEDNQISKFVRLEKWAKAAEFKNRCNEGGWVACRATARAGCGFPRIRPILATPRPFPWKRPALGTGRTAAAVFSLPGEALLPRVLQRARFGREPAIPPAIWPRA